MTDQPTCNSILRNERSKWGKHGLLRSMLPVMGRVTVWRASRKRRHLLAAKLEEMGLLG